MRALITARDLMSAPRVWKFSDINVLDVGARDRQRHNVFGLASGRAGMTADAARMVNNLRPLHLMIARLVNWEFSHRCAHLILLLHPTPTFNFTTEDTEGRKL
jgi:hypothetical protein